MVGVELKKIVVWFEEVSMLTVGKSDIQARRRQEKKWERDRRTKEMRSGGRRLYALP